MKYLQAANPVQATKEGDCFQTPSGKCFHLQPLLKELLPLLPLVGSKLGKFSHSRLRNHGGVNWRETAFSLQSYFEGAFGTKMDDFQRPLPWDQSAADQSGLALRPAAVQLLSIMKTGVEFLPIFPLTSHAVITRETSLFLDFDVFVCETDE